MKSLNEICFILFSSMRFTKNNAASMISLLYYADVSITKDKLEKKFFVMYKNNDLEER